MLGPVPLAVLLVSASSFLGLTAAALAGTLPLEAEMRHALLAWASPVMLEILEVVNFFGDWRVILPGSLLLFAIFPHARARWAVWLLLVVAVPLAESAAKYIVARPRPEDLSLGFPSGHVTAAAAFFSALCYMAGALPSRRARLAVRTAAGLMVVMVALARVLLRAHWPTDALGGAALGLALASAAALVAQAPAGEER